jgi:alkyldihydroxyacetonephosphate synthase
LRRGAVDAAPDAVVYPDDAESVARILRTAAELAVAVVPYGGGTSVVGGVEATVGAEQRGAIALDTTRLDRLLDFDPVSRTATFQAGIDGPALEKALDERGFTLGHFPQSFEHSTLGGWIAARSSGQQSDGYGSIDDLLVAVRLVTPEGEIRTSNLPRTATGPDVREIVLGSEGVLGVVVEATLRIRPKPVVRDFRGVLFKRFEDGAAAVRDAAVERVPLTMMRLSDATETEVSTLLHRDPSTSFDPASLFLATAERAGYAAERCVLLYGAEGVDRDAVRRSMTRARRIARAHGGLPLGSRPGRAWLQGRFRAPYLRDRLLDYGVGIDTFETAFTWRRLEAAHEAVLAGMRRAAEAHAGAGIAMSHVSHSYETGACLYFTLLYAVDFERDVEQWLAIKRDITDTILESHGALSHHHGVGLDHAPWLAREKGDLALDALRALKRRLDPSGVMNPGKLL